MVNEQDKVPCVEPTMRPRWLSRSRGSPVSRSLPRTRGPNQVRCWLVSHKGTKTFKFLTAILLVLPFLVVVMHFRPGRPHGAITRSAYSGAGPEETSWAASWPCIQGLPQGIVQDLYGIGDGKSAIDMLVYQSPVPLHSTITSSSSSSFMRFILALGAGSKGLQGTLNPNALTLGRLIKYIWEAKEKQGDIFKTSVKGAETRHSQGKDFPWACELYRNPGRASKPSSMAATQVNHVSIPFEEDIFSFLMAPSQDLMFWYQLPQDEEGGSSRSSKSSRSSGSSSQTITTQCQPVERGDFAEREEAQKHQHGVFINPYPIGDLSGVLCPFIFEKRPQVLSDSLDALTVGLSFAAELLASNEAMDQEPRQTAKKTKLRLGFNSWGARATINHLHFQFWSFSDGPDGLIPIERLPLRQPMLTSFPGVELSVIGIKHHPIRSMALSGTSVPALAKAGAHCLDVLVSRNIPFSLLMNGKHLYIMPRRFSDLTLDFTSVGFPEAAGLLLVMNETQWRDETLLNADIVWDLWDKTYGVSGEVFKELVEECTEMPADEVEV